MLIKRTIQIFSDPTYHSQCPLTGFEKKNVSKVCHIFLESISYDNSKMVCLKILASGISELTVLNGPENVKNWISGVKTSKKKNFLTPPYNFSHEK